jgi:hypothetical protein
MTGLSEKLDMLQEELNAMAQSPGLLKAALAEDGDGGRRDGEAAKRYEEALKEVSVPVQRLLHSPIRASTRVSRRSEHGN